MGALDRNEADMGVANLFLSYKRIGVVDFSAPYDFEVWLYLCVDVSDRCRHTSSLFFLLSLSIHHIYLYLYTSVSFTVFFSAW